MADNTRIGLGMGMTISVGDYEYVRPQVYIEKTIPEDVDEEEFIDDLYTELEEEFDAMLHVHFEKMQELRHA